MGSKPNVLLICTDHWGGPLTGSVPHPVLITPTVNQLRRNGVTFTNAYSACPSCIPARRTLMTGMTARSHGDRSFQERAFFPEVSTLPQCFRDEGYQAFAVGKLHVYPQRNRIGFDDVLLEEQGRRDPRRPGFWYLSFSAPHPPMTPLQCYLDLYRDVEMDRPATGDWSADPDQLPYMIKTRNLSRSALVGAPGAELELARRAFYATITHIDHQIRMVVGALREEGILDDTILLFTSDHGHMVGEHGLWTVMPLLRDVSQDSPGAGPAEPR